jgi:protein phosphatase
VPVLSAALTDLGLRRPANEDSYVSRPGLGLHVVCDGMGGHAAGEIASRVAADTIEAFVQQPRVNGSSRGPIVTAPRKGWQPACRCPYSAKTKRVPDEPWGMALTAV